MVSHDPLAYLPFELINAAAALAAEQDVYTDRAWVVQLALVGHEVFRAVRPILYADLIITGQNVKKILSVPSLQNRVLQYVRRITASQLYADNQLEPAVDPSECLDAILQDWNPNSESYIQVPWKSLKGLLLRLSRDSPIGDSRLTRLDLGSTTFSDACLNHWTGIPLAIAQSLTHVSGLIPMSWASVNFDDAAPTPRSWAHAIVDALPSLTHIGLIALSYPHRYSRFHSIFDGSNDYQSVGIAISALLERRASLFVTLRAVGESDNIRLHLSMWQSTQHLYLHPRLTLWMDERYIRTFAMAEALVVQDARGGRNIWSGPPEDDGYEIDALLGCLDE